MKVICNRGALLDALIVAGNVVAARTPKPVLQCVKLTAEDNRLTVAATDLEVAIRYSDSQVQVRGVMVRRAAILVGVFNGGVASLNSLLREWDIAARDGVQVGLGGNLRLHDVLRLVDETICVSD